MRFTLSLIVFITTSFLYGQETQLLRQPTLSDKSVVFVYANDLWSAPLSGGNATRLTSGEGYESSPHFSPDGRQIAFTAEYDGNTAVYVIPSEGGQPKRLTYHPSNNIVQGWTPDGQILFRSDRESRPTETNKFYTVSTTGGLPKAMIIPRAAYGEISPDGNFVAYVPITFWDPEWRNYRGGQAMPIWIVNLNTNELITTPQPTQERHLDPVWINNKVYYISERDFTSNIWSFDPNTKAEEQITFHSKYDVKSLDANQTHIVYEQGGYLHVLDPVTKHTSQLSITVASDQNFARRRWENVSDNQLTNANLSPNGKRALFEYRGEIFSTPKKDGTWRNISNHPGAADRYPIWSPTGDQIAWFSDRSGEYQLVIADQFGEIKKTISIPNPTFFFQPDWSPDGKYISFTDTDYKIWLVDINANKSEVIGTDSYAHPVRTLNPQWSPDSKWIAYAKQLNSHFKAIFVYHILTKETLQITDGQADVISPVWDVNGKFIYCLGSTDYGLASGWLDMSSYDPKVNRNLYGIALSAATSVPMLPKSDEESTEENNNDVDKDTNAVVVTIDKAGIMERLFSMDLSASNYTALYKGPAGSIFIGESIAGESGLTLHKYDIEKQKAEKYFDKVSNIALSTDRKNLLLQQSGKWYSSSTASPPKTSDDQLVTGIKYQVDPVAEYHQIFKEGWRYMRDFLYVDNVHGAPWDDIYKWYAPWIDHVRHRTDLNYVVDIMSGEVSIGHSYVSGGDMPDIDRVPVGLLGCDFIIENGHYKISKIYRGENWNPNTYAPLGLPGLNVNEGDYLLSVNGHTLTADLNIFQLLEQAANRTIYIKVNQVPNLTGAREVLVKPVPSERSLRYNDWVEGNRRKVDLLSNGKLAYVYVPNTSGNGFQSFNRYYFSQQDKKGVIIDERNNGGGSAADYMIDILDREVVGYFNSKANDNRPWTTPMAGIYGPKVMIINERAGSGGDLLPYMFKAKNLGTLVGTRTWGGLVGTWDTPRFIDGGRMVAPRGGFYDVDGNWAVEGVGISPDIEVIQEPKKVIEGHDPQLERAVEEALRLLQNGEFQLKPEPAAPNKWKRAPGYDKNK